MATYTGADKAIDYLFTASNNTTAEYDNTATYAVGAFVIYAGTLYKCTTAISTPEDFTPAHWTQTTIMENAGGGGGGGTTVIANPAGAATDTLNKLQVGATIYSIPSGGGGGNHIYSTTEQIVGTWIDGRTVYETTYEFASQLWCASNSWVETVISSSGISQIISALAFGPSNEFWGFFAASPTGYQHVRLLSARPTQGVYVKFLVMQYLKPTT